MTDLVQSAPARSTDDADELAAASLALARRFSRGATMWCVAPEWPEQARHVAVEFVHPVIVGTRALPAVQVGGPGLVAALRALVRPGDVVCAVSAAADQTVASTFRRSRAWGALTIWIGAGSRPPAGAADHVLWSESDGDAALAPHDGSLSLRYHMLWELTHVCFDHPGLLNPPEEGSGEDPDTHDVDGDRLAEVVSATGRLQTRTTVRTAAGVEVVDTAAVGPLAAGSLILVRAGSAIAVLEQEL